VASLPPLPLCAPLTVTSGARFVDSLLLFDKTRPPPPPAPAPTWHLARTWAHTCLLSLPQPQPQPQQSPPCHALPLHHALPFVMRCLRPCPVVPPSLHHPSHALPVASCLRHAPPLSRRPLHVASPHCNTWFRLAVSCLSSTPSSRTPFSPHIWQVQSLVSCCFCNTAQLELYRTLEFSPTNVDITYMHSTACKGTASCATYSHPPTTPESAKQAGAARQNPTHSHSLHPGAAPPRCVALALKL
jgi:hypothetical protein